MNNFTNIMQVSRWSRLLTLTTYMVFLSFGANIRAQVPIAIYNQEDQSLTFSVVTNMEAEKYATMEKYEGCFWQNEDVVNVSDNPGWLKYRDNIKTVIIGRSFSDCKPKSTSRWFMGCNVLEIIKGLDYLDTSEVTDMESMFDCCTSLKEIDVSKFNTSNVTDMSQMFQHCESLLVLNLSGFDTSNVTRMSWMFNGCNSIPYIDVSNFNTSKLEYCTMMFHACYALRILDLTNFSTQKLICCNFMFMECIALHTIYCNDTWTISDDMSQNMFNTNNKLSGAVPYNVDNANTCKFANPDNGYFTRKGVEGDVNKDGKVDISDVVKIINIIANN